VILLSGGVDLGLKPTRVRRPIAALVSLTLALLSGAASASPEIAAIRHWTAPDHTRIVVDLTGDCRYSTRALTDPDRIVVLVVDGSVGDAPRTSPVGDGLVDRVRLNQLRSGAQVVVDLTKASGHNVFPLDAYGEKPNRIVIDVFREGASTAAAPSEEAEPSGVRIVVIDPGHGGEDPGTVGNGKLREKDVVLDIAKRLAATLDSRGGYETRLTRKGDYFVSLSKRKTIANDSSGDVFVSIHANSAPNRTASGTELFFVSPRGASDQASRELADRENACDLVGGVSPDADDDVLSILVDLKMSDSVQKSSNLASLMGGKLRQSGTSACVVKQAGFVVLKNLAMPSVLVEVGFLTNASDVKKLAGEDYRQTYAVCLADALDEYFQRHQPAASTPDGRHKVARGETLWSIAKRYNMTVEDLRELNGLSPSSTIRVDQVLSVRKA
jgi:N-acetylmuramoyl-L-alanine amidase